jgi:hypothetical protein
MSPPFGALIELITVRGFPGRPRVDCHLLLV